MGGNAHQQRKMRRAVQQILHSYGYSPNNKANDNGKKKLGLLDFLYKYLLPAVALAGFGHWIAQFSVIVASGAYVLALVLPFLGAWIWCDTRWKRIVLKIGAGLAALVFLWQDYHWIREEWTPSFLLLVPSHELIDCERRAFFVNHFGPKPLQGITIVIKDNSGGAVQQDDSYRTGIGLGPQDPDVPRYIWVKPLHPWDEDYTIKVSAAHFHSTQRVVLRSVAKHLEFAVEISTDDTKKPVLSCRDTLFPSSNPVAQGAHDICAAPMAENQAFLSRLQPSVYGVQDAAGSYTVVKFRTLSPPFDLDSQSDDRHLTEYQKTVMKYKLSKYSGAKLLVLYAGGSKTLSYANELADFFHSLEWKIKDLA